MDFNNKIVGQSPISPINLGKRVISSNNLIARTLTRIQLQGRRGFYEGKTADQIVAEMKSGNGIITHSDLKNYKSKWRKPSLDTIVDIKSSVWDPPSSGGIAIDAIAARYCQLSHCRLGS